VTRLALATAAALALASAAAAQPADPHAHHQHTPAAPPPASADPHAGHAASSPPAGQPPPIPADRDADRHFGREAMDAAREVLRREHGDLRWAKVVIERLEWRPDRGHDAWFWDGSISYGGDINRFVLRSEGEGERDVESAEFRALYSRAISPFFNLQAGVRQDVEPRERTYATVGIEGLAPYLFEVEGALFVSDRGDVTARFEGALDWRLTQQLILEPRAEANLAAQDIPALGVGSGLSNVELGLRLRYEIVPELAPYVGVHYERSFGDTARRLRAAGEPRGDARAVIGIRTWF
jgi:copper resistance protein B